MNKKLYRSREQRMLAGVCGGIAEYFNIDVTIVRLIWAVLALPTFGTALIVYIMAAVIVPEDIHNDGEREQVTFVDVHPTWDKSKVMPILGIFLIVVGVMALIGGIFPVLWRLIRKGFWPTIIIVIGIGFIYSSWRYKGNS